MRPLTNTQASTELKPLGVIEALTAGFELVRKRPWTIILPILLDLAIWFLPRLSLTALFRPTAEQMFATSDLASDAENAKQLQEAMNQFVGSLDVLGLVSAALNATARLPSLLALDSGAVHSPFHALAYTISIQSESVALFLFIPLFLLGLFAAALYIEWIAQGVRPLEKESPFAWVPRVAWLYVRLIGLTGIFAIVLFASGIILTLLQMFAPLNADVGSLIVALVGVGWFWLMIYFFFVVGALAVHNVGVVQAIRRSIAIFRLYFWPAGALVALTLFLERGLMLVWRGLAVSDVGILLAIVLNAIVGTGLLAAMLLFYQDRIHYTEKIIARAQAARR